MKTGSTQHVIVGTAGHIDHGKTSLVKQLTGIDTDRLPEEQARGISIDLGFAHFDVDEFHFGLVDVPGHERFVKNMVAGATGIDVALLVVAADDSVMPQTREHLEIMDLLGVTAGVVAVTKIDLVDPAFVELVQADVAHQVRGTFLEGAPVIPVSSQTGAGIECLRRALVDVARRRKWTTRTDLFRMPIDRVFSLTGHGTIVTGSVMEGQVRAGDTLELLPEQTAVRVRSVQSHGAQVSESGAHRRTAINLAGIKTDEVQRGQELATPGYLQPAKRLLVSVRCLSSAPIELRDRLQLALHIGTRETAARLILKGQTIEPGDIGYAELRLAAPIVAIWGQRFILRRPSPALTVAGGMVLDPAIEPRRRISDLEARARPLETADESARLAAYLAERDVVEASPLTAAWKVGINSGNYDALLARLVADEVLISIGSRDSLRKLHRGRLETLMAGVLKRIRLSSPLISRDGRCRAGMLQTACHTLGPAELVDAAFEQLLKDQKLVRVGENIGPADTQVQLSKNQVALRSKVLEQIGKGGLTPPNLKELALSLGQKVEQIQPLLTLCIEDGLLLDVGSGLHYTPAALEKARVVCQTTLEQEGGATMSQLREAWGVTRKYSVPLCEWFDAHGLTLREGDLRRAGPELAKPLAE